MAKNSSCDCNFTGSDSQVVELMRDSLTMNVRVPFTCDKPTKTFFEFRRMSDEEIIENIVNK